LPEDEFTTLKNQLGHLQPDVQQHSLLSGSGSLQFYQVPQLPRPALAGRLSSSQLGHRDGQFRPFVEHSPDDPAPSPVVPQRRLLGPEAQLASVGQCSGIPFPARPARGLSGDLRRGPVVQPHQLRLPVVAGAVGHLCRVQHRRWRGSGHLRFIGPRRKTADPTTAAENRAGSCADGHWRQTPAGHRAGE